MSIITGSPIVASDIEDAINTGLVEYTSLIVAGGLKGKDFIASTQGMEFVAGATVALFPTYHPGITAREILIDDMLVGDFVYVTDETESDGIVAGNSVCAPFYCFGAQTFLWANEADAIAHVRLLMANKLADLQVSDPATIQYGSIVRTYFSASDQATFGRGHAASGISAYGFPNPQ